MDIALKDILYLAHITSDLPNYVTKEYKGICATTWKELFGNHKKAFRNEDYEIDPALSREVWRLKRKECKYSITWQKDRNFPSYIPGCMKCSLCMNEKLEIALYNEGNLLNKHNEIISRCHHRHKHKLLVLN